MRSLIRKLYYEPGAMSWLLFFFPSFICAVVPFIGPAFWGAIANQIVETDATKKVVHVFWSSLMGVLAHSLVFHLPNWIIEAVGIVLMLNMIGLLTGIYLKKIFLFKN